MATTHNQWLTIAKIFSAIGALTIFGPWLTIDYYDHYGYMFFSYNGFTLFDSGYFFGVAMFIPIIVSLMFVASFIRVHVYPNERNCRYMILILVVMFLICWYYNIAADGVYDNYPYFTEIYGSGLAETGSLIFAFLNVIFVYLADSAMDSERRLAMQPMAETPVVTNRTDEETIAFTTSDGKRFCPNCGAALYNADTHDFCPNCGKNLREESENR